MLLCGNSVEAMRIRSKLRMKRSLKSSDVDVYLAETENGDMAGIAIWERPPVDSEKEEREEDKEYKEDEKKFTAIILPELTAWMDGDLATGSERLSEESFGEQRKAAWNLTILCVDPGYQGQGIVRKLADPGMKKAWAENRPIILDTGNRNVVKMYERFGFRVKGETTFHIPGTSGSSTWWAMMAAVPPKCED